MEDIKKQRRNFISLSELGYDHLKFRVSIQEGLPTFDEGVGRNNRYKD